MAKLNVEITIVATKEKGELVSRIKTAATPGMTIQEKVPIIVQSLISSFVQMVHLNLDPNGSVKCYEDAKNFIDAAIERAKIQATQSSPENLKLNLN